MKLFREPIDTRLARFDHFICHVTATKPSKIIDDKWIDKVHRQRGFSRGTGYHAFIGQGGKVYTHDLGHKMRPFDQAGAHVGGCGSGWNGRSFGLVLEGGLDEHTGKPADTLNATQSMRLEDVCIQFARAHPRPHEVTWLGHRDLIRQTRSSPKACPCFDFPEFVERFRIIEKATAEDNEDRGVRTDMDDAQTLHIVEKGETLWGIAMRHHTTVEHLKRVNGLTLSFIIPGDTLLIE